MLRELYLNIANERTDFLKIKHIQYNILKRIGKLKYITYRRIDINLCFDGCEEITWDNAKTAVIKVSAPKRLESSLESKETIVELYKIVFAGLKKHWQKNNWNLGDLNEMHNAIIKEDYKSHITSRKSILSKNRKRKAELYCELQPDYSDYFLIISERRKELYRFNYLHGISDPGMFFGFFPNFYWIGDESVVLSDLNKEIFYVFDMTKGNFSIDYRPLYNTIEELKNYVKAYQAGLSPNERLKLLGLPIRKNL